MRNIVRNLAVMLAAACAPGCASVEDSVGFRTNAVVDCGVDLPNGEPGPNACYCAGCNAANPGDPVGSAEPAPAFPDCGTGDIVESAYIPDGNLGSIGVVELRHSLRCGAVWAVIWSQHPQQIHPTQIAAYVFDDASPDSAHGPSSEGLEQPYVIGDRSVWWSAMYASSPSRVACGWFAFTNENGGRTRYGICSNGQQINHPPDCSKVEISPNLYVPETADWVGHEDRTITVGPVTDIDGDDVEISINAITQNQPTQGPGQGAGATCGPGADRPPGGDAGRPSGTSGFQATPVTWASDGWLRVERDGVQHRYSTGRTYWVGMAATDGELSCTAQPSACVAHSPEQQQCSQGQAVFSSLECPCSTCPNCPSYCNDPTPVFDDVCTNETNVQVSHSTGGLDPYWYSDMRTTTGCPPSATIRARATELIAGGLECAKLRARIYPSDGEPYLARFSQASCPYNDPVELAIYHQRGTRYLIESENGAVVVAVEH